MTEMITEIPEKLINLEALFASKNPYLLKFIPGFFLNYLKKLLHQDAINGYIYNHREKSGLPFIKAILQEFGVNIITQIHGKGLERLHENLAALLLDRRLIIASNHPLGGLDGLAMMDQIGLIRSDLVFPVNDILMNVPGLKPLFIPINKHGKNTENARIIEETFASNKVILYFPAGLVSRKFKGGIITDLEWKNTFIKKAKKHQRDVLPVFISGRNTDRFYNLANWRKKFGIKTNIEMFLLVDEMMKQKGRTIKIILGDIIPWTRFDKSENDQQWAEYVKQRVYELRQ
jgi:hypothetical protein